MDESQDQYVEYTDKSMYKENHLRYYAYSIIIGFVLVLVCIAVLITILILCL